MPSSAFFILKYEQPLEVTFIHFVDELLYVAKIQKQIMLIHAYLILK